MRLCRCPAIGSVIDDGTTFDSQQRKFVCTRCGLVGGVSAAAIRFRKSKKRRELIASIVSKLSNATEYELREALQKL